MAGDCECLRSGLWLRRCRALRRKDPNGKRGGKTRMKARSAVSQSRSRSRARSSLGRAWVEPGSSLGRAWVELGSSRGRACVEPGSSRGRAWVEPGSSLGRAWSEPGRAWVEPGSSLGRAWVEPGSRLGRAWAEPGPSLSRALSGVGGVGELKVRVDRMLWCCAHFLFTRQIVQLLCSRDKASLRFGCNPLPLCFLLCGCCLALRPRLAA